MRKTIFDFPPGTNISMTTETIVGKEKVLVAQAITFSLSTIKDFKYTGLYTEKEELDIFINLVYREWESKGIIDTHLNNLTLTLRK